jgi:hypothetical protein
MYNWHIVSKLDKERVNTAGTGNVSECSVEDMGGAFTEYRNNNTAYITEFGEKGAKAETANNMQIVS